MVQIVPGMFLLLSPGCDIILPLCDGLVWPNYIDNKLRIKTLIVIYNSPFCMWIIDKFRTIRKRNVSNLCVLALDKKGMCVIC